MAEQAMLAQALRNLGASSAQAEAMAAQLLKRSAQLAAERGTTPERELEYLLRAVVQSRRGGGLSAEYEQRHPPKAPPAAGVP